MSIISKVGQNSLRTRLLNGSIHFILLIGAVTMLYPFLLMISSSIKSSVDNNQINLIPRYLYEDDMLYKKYIESRYNEESSRLMDNYPGSWIAFSEVTLPEEPSRQIYDDWEEFITLYGERYGPYHFYVAEHYGRGVYPYAQRQYRSLLRRENNNSLAEFNLRYNTGASSWEEIAVEEKEIYRRNFVSATDGYLGRFRTFKMDTPQWMRYYVNPDGAFVNLNVIPAYGGNLQTFNERYNLSYNSWNEIIIPTRSPEPDHYLYDHWVYYVKNVINIQHLGIQDEAEPSFRRMLEDKYGTITLLNTTWLTDFNNFEEVVIPDRIPDSGAIVEDLSFFLEYEAEPADIRVHSISQDFRDFLSDKYESIEAFNAATQRVYPSFEKILFPVAELDYYPFIERKGPIRREFITRNYAMAFDQMLADARSLRNTGIYVLLSILIAVTVNPMAAYALSRFKPRFTHQIIMIFMLTMAFPAMVMGIPNFLMLKRLNLLNTFWALVLPAAADGYFIFLLKGFFDSLPKEIFENARLDGAGEFRLFWQFTIMLSKPIMAVIALGAFNAAYRNFLFAFIVCQDQSMWTLMVHIYELMQRASAGVGYAALVIAAIPTLAVFIFFQNIIIKGIVIPMEK